MTTPTRREFIRRTLLATTAGLVPVHALGLQPASRARRAVTVSGRRVRTVDVHAHTAVPDALSSIVRGTPLENVVRGQVNGNLVMNEARLRAMDDQGIDVEVLTINPYWYGADRALASQLIPAQNEALAKLVAAHPDRFVALATVALQHPDLAAEQLQQAFDRHGMRGAGIGPTVGTDELSAPKFDPFWARAESLGAMIFMHPSGVPELRDRLQGNGFLTNVIGNPLETTIALSHLIFEGTLDRFPRLRLCGAHAGGFLPAYIGRFDQGCVAFPANCTPKNARKPSAYLRQLYFDSMVFTGEGLRHLAAECGADHIFMGTDYPFPWTTTSVDHILNAPGFSDAEREAMLGGNAVTLLGLR
ncbi:MAG: amidohydrolase family protein [Vicinamibacterales bacterium]